MKNLIKIGILLFSLNSFGYMHQTDNYSCGAVAIYNALYSKGKEVSLDEIRKIAKTTREGTKFKDFVEAARHYNLKIKRILPENIKMNGTYFIALVVLYPKSEGWDFYGHYVFMNKGVVYNLLKGETEHPVDILTIQAMLYKMYPFPLIWEIK